MADEFGRVFLSYRREETRHVAGRFADQLEHRIGPENVFLDIDGMQPGADVRETIVEQVRSCRLVVALIGPKWVSLCDSRGRRRLHGPGDFVNLEILTALECGIRIIPVLVDGADMPRAEELPGPIQELALRSALRLDHESFKSDSKKLLSAIEQGSAAAAVEAAAARAAAKEAAAAEEAAAEAAAHELDSVQPTPQVPDGGQAELRRVRIRIGTVPPEAVNDVGRLGTETEDPTAESYLAVQSACAAVTEGWGSAHRRAAYGPAWLARALPTRWFRRAFVEAFRRSYHADAKRLSTFWDDERWYIVGRNVENLRVEFMRIARRPPRKYKDSRGEEVCVPGRVAHIPTDESAKVYCALAGEVQSQISYLTQVVRKGGR
jgi:TIR domain